MYYDVTYIEKAEAQRYIPDLSLLHINRFLNDKTEYYLLKRLIDISLSALFLAILSPLLVLVIILIRIDSKGPAIFKQRRIGLHGKSFTFYKFRSMRIESVYNTPIVSKEGFLYKSKEDKRITRIGRILRRTSIDELPQLFNVLVGDMSLIGPRPLIKEMLEAYPLIKTIRSMIKPGLTGYWQISCRDKNNSVLDMIDWDIYYIKHCCLSFDIKILIKTMEVVINGKGAV